MICRVYKVKNAAANLAYIVIKINIALYKIIFKTLSFIILVIVIFIKIFKLKIYYSSHKNIKSYNVIINKY